jgi:hypothetical protein
MMARRPRALLFAGAAVVSSTASDERAYSRRFWTLSHQSPADFPWFGLGADVPQPALWMQSTSISTCHSGSMKRATPTKVQAGRISPNTSPWARAASCHQSMTVSIPRVRTTSSLVCAWTSLRCAVRPCGPIGAVDRDTLLFLGIRCSDSEVSDGLPATHRVAENAKSASP